MIGWIGSLLLSFCGLPQAIKCYKTRSAIDISWIFLLMWFFGEVFTLLYILLWEHNLIEFFYKAPLVFNYTINIVIVIYIAYIKKYFGG